MRVGERTSKKNIADKIFLSPEMKLTVFFENQQQFNARAGQKKTHVFFGNARPKFIARAHLKQRKKNIVA